MIQKIVLFMLSIFDYFYQKKLIEFLKKKGFKKPENYQIGFSKNSQFPDH